MCHATTETGNRCTRRTKALVPIVATNGLPDRQYAALCRLHLEHLNRGALRMDVPAEYKPGHIRRYWAHDKSA